MLHKRAELRPIDSEVGLLNRADGSARYSQGGSSVVVAVYGPLEVKRGVKEKLDRASIDVVWRPRIGPSDYTNREKEAVLRGILESAIITSLHPQTSISIIVQVMQDSAINAISLALLDAGLPLHYVPSSASCAIKDDNILLDPNSYEEQGTSAFFTFTFASTTTDGVVMCKSTGTTNETQYFECLKICKIASEKIVSFFRKITEVKVNKQSAQ